MIWNKWRRAPALDANELRDAAAAVVAAVTAHLAVDVEIAEDAIIWAFPKDDLLRAAALLDPDERELADGWRDDLEEVGGGHYIVALEVEAEDDGTDGDTDDGADAPPALRFTWDPKWANNGAAWPVAWLVVTRFIAKIGATQLTTSASALLEPPPSIGATTVTLPLLALRSMGVLPTGRIVPLDVGRPASLAALDAVIANLQPDTPAYCIAATQLKPSTTSPELADLYPIATIVRLLKMVPNGDSRMVMLVGTDRVRLDTVTEMPNGFLEATGHVVRDGELVNPGARDVILDAAEQALKLAIMTDEIADDALAVLRRVEPARLADVVVETVEFLFPDASTLRVETLQQTDVTARAVAVLEAVAKRISAIGRALDAHGGDLGAARLAAFKDELAKRAER